MKSTHRVKYYKHNVITQKVTEYCESEEKALALIRELKTQHNITKITLEYLDNPREII